MNNKLFVIVFLSIILLAVSCKDNLTTPEKVNIGEVENIKKSDKDNIQQNNGGGMQGPIEHWCKCLTDCIRPSYDCFPEIVVTAERPKNDFINELDRNIANNTVSQFFSETGNYRELYPNFNGTALQDLRNEITTVRKVGDSESLFYRIVSFHDPEIPYGYSSGEYEVDPATLDPEYLQPCDCP